MTNRKTIMRRLNITERILDKLGFSEYWDEDATWGGRTLTFSNGTSFRIIEQEERDDEDEGYGYEAIYISNHYYFAGYFATPKIYPPYLYYDLFFLHEMYECIEKEYPDCIDEFVANCKDLNMKPYIDDYLNERVQNKTQFHRSSQPNPKM
jgi:hypothetical protein